jgi:ABC-type antimicrobial peptide transport system permease subunit
VRRVVIWEQGFILALAVGLGIGLGAFLSAVTLKALPLLVLSSSIGGPIEAGGMPPVTVWPWPLLAGALGAVIVICALVVVIAARVAARPAAESALRLASE